MRLLGCLFWLVVFIVALILGLTLLIHSDSKYCDDHPDAQGCEHTMIQPERPSINDPRAALRVW